jgi:MinD superfamily P-loop ATPase
LGNNEVFEYLQKEKIPLLMSVPFDKNIAAIYSKGLLVSNENAEWEQKFNQLYTTILENYGNSSN